jgi:hypothetical protein
VHIVDLVYRLVVTISEDSELALVGIEATEAVVVMLFRSDGGKNGLWCIFEDRVEIIPFESTCAS